MAAWLEFVQDKLYGGFCAVAADDAHRRDAKCGRDVAADYKSLVRGPALVDRSNRGLLEVTGKDRSVWLHNLTSNQVKPLTAGQGNYAFVLNIQGRILFDLNLLVRDGSIWLDLERRFVDAARIHFSKYTIVEDVTIVDRSEEWVRLACVGDSAVGAMALIGVPHAANIPALGTAEATWGAVPMTAVRTDFCGPWAMELFVPATSAVDVWNGLTDPGWAMRAIPVGEEAVQVRRIEAGLPWPGMEITDDVLPAETRQLDRAVSFNKGCYLGQEVVERMRSRHVVARQLVGLEISTDGPAPAGAALLGVDDKPVGTLTSCCRSLAKPRIIGLGYVKTALSTVGQSLRVAWEGRSAEAVVAALPFVPGRPG